MSNPRVATTANDGVLTAVGQVRRVLSRILWTRMLLQAAGVGVGSWLLLLFLRRGTSAIPMMVAITVSSIVALACLALLWRRLGVVTALRAALWIEEHGGSGYALVTWVEQSLGGSPSSPWLGHVVADASRTSLARARAALAPLARSQLAGPLGFVVGAALVAWGSAVAPERLINAIVASRTAGTRAVRAAPIGAWRVRVTPPAYSGLPVQELGDVTSVRALSGARIVVVGSDAVPDSVRTRELSDSAAATKHATKHATVDVVPDGWRSEIIATDGPLEARVTRDRFAKLLLVEGVPDSIPRVTLTAPVRDSVLRSATGRLPLVARMHDDIGLARASFEVVISSGEGERFTARTVEVGVQALRGAHDDTLRAVLDLAALQLGPGDVIHMRATARDAHPMAAREAGTSETRSFRVARPSEYDSVAVEPAPPPEVDKSLLSQRMLLMLTERLEARRPRLAVTTLREESRTLARDQGRLRQAVGDAVFQRLTGDAGGEHSHSADDGHDHGVEAVGGKLALSGVNTQGMLEEGDDSPVIAINKPLLEAYNAMWDAGRALEQAEPRAAIPFMRIALEAIERARAASRLYLRGKPPTVIVDLAKVRLAGKDTGAPAARAARLALPSHSAAREARLLAAASLVPVDAAAARDSLAVLRIESLADAPAFAEALTALLEEFSQGNGAGITEPFLRARRVLGGIERIPASPWSRGGPP